MRSPIKARASTPAIAATFTVLIVLFLTSCTRSLSRETLVGTYYLKHPQAGSIELTLRADGSFAETIRPASGQTVIIRGTWLPPDYRNRAIGLEGLWIPREFAPNYILRADEISGSGVKYTTPGYWVATPEQWFGKIAIPVFPDADIKFERVSP